jgi:hypothetical protein
MPAGALSRRRRTWAIVLVAAVLVVVGVISWIRVAGSLRNDVHITLVRPISCTGTTISQRVLGVPPQTFDVIRARPGMDCTVEVRYANDGSWGVHLSSTTFAVLGPGNSSLMVMSGPREEPSRSGPRSIDAGFTLDRDLDAGQSFEVKYHLRFQPKGCSDGTVYEWNVPTLDVSALGRSGRIHGGLRLAESGVYRAGCPR